MFVFGMLSPAQGKAEQVEAVTDPAQDSLTEELLIVDDRFQNLQSGQVWIWDTSIYVKVRSEDAAHVKDVLERRAAEIQMGIGQIFGRAQHAHLKEPDRQTLRDQIMTFLLGVVRTTEDAEPLIQTVLIPKCRGVPTGG